MEKVEDYIRLRKPFLVNDLEAQKVLWDRRKVNNSTLRARIHIGPCVLLELDSKLFLMICFQVYALLQSQDIPVPVHAVMSRDVRCILLL